MSSSRPSLRFGLGRSSSETHTSQHFRPFGVVRPAPASCVVHTSVWAKRPLPYPVLDPRVHLTFSSAFHNSLHSCTHPVLRMLWWSKGGELLLLNGWIFAANWILCSEVSLVLERSSGPIQMDPGTLELLSLGMVERTQVLGLDVIHIALAWFPFQLRLYSEPASSN